MKKDPFYVQDSLSSQFDNEDKIRQQKKLDFMEQQKKDYLEYLQMKDNKRTGTPFKITEDVNYHPPIKNLDSQDANLCTNIAKDNQYSRAGYQVNKWKIPDKYEKNFDEKYIKGKNRKEYNIINHQIYDVEEQNNQKINPTLRQELSEYEKKIQEQMKSQYPPIKDMIRPQYEEDNNPQMRENVRFPPINERRKNINPYENQQDFNRNQMYNNYNPNINNNIYDKKDMPLPNEDSNNQRDDPRLNDIEYKNYLEYIKQRELMEKEKEYEEYLRQKELMQREEQDRQKYNYNMNQNLPNYHTFINTAEDYNNKQKSYIDSYAENLEKQRKDLEFKRQQEQKVLTKENMELYAQQQQNNKFKDNIGQLPFDRFQEEREEYLSNKKKNISTYSNLTSMTTTNPALKNDPNVTPYIDPEKALEMKIKEEKMKKYRRELDEQIRTRPQEAYGRINNDKRIEVPPDPCKYIFFNINIYRLKRI